jgi:hypothetical protein
MYNLSCFKFLLQKTINAVVEFFQSNKGLDLEQITSATLMKLEEIKERTATGEIFSVSISTS